MAKDYTMEELWQRAELAGQDIATFYKQPFINYRGWTSDSGELYTEIIAKWCIENIRLFDQIPQITREASYKTPSHNGKPGNTDSNRTEELIAMAMFRQGELPIVGQILDYQTPLKNKHSDHAGKIDLLAYDGKILRILELKEPASTESMLRCILEGYTYLRTANKDKLLADFLLPSDTPIQASPFVFLNGCQHREMLEPRPYLKQLAELLNSRPFYATAQENGYYDAMEEQR